MNRYTHPLQSEAWAKFREKTGTTVIKVSNLYLTIHKIPLTKFTIGYLPKGPLPTKTTIKKLTEIGKKGNCIFIKLEPNVKTIENLKLKIENLGLRSSLHPLFTKYTFQIDLTKSEEELLKAMHPKTRYNIRVAQKHGVRIVEATNDKAFKTYLKLLNETIRRQKFYAHDKRYHKLMWETLKSAGIAHLLVAKYKNEPLVAWILFVYNGILYYPYGASSDKHKETMASNLMMWEAIHFGKKMGCKIFDMWGSLGPNPDKNDPWYGFHRFKEGYGGKLIEFVGSYDFVLNLFLYQLYSLIHFIRWAYLRLKTR